MEQNTDTTHTHLSENTKEPLQIGGWLFLIGFGIVISPLRLAVNLFEGYWPIFTDGTIEDIMMNASTGFAMLIIAEIVVNIATVILSVYLIKLFFQKKAKFAKWYFLTAIFTTSFLLIDTFILSQMFPDLDVLTIDIVKGIASGFVSLLIWSPYLYKSERSKNTFIVN